MNLYLFWSVCQVDESLWHKFSVIRSQQWLRNSVITPCGVLTDRRSTLPFCIMATLRSRLTKPLGHALGYLRYSTSHQGGNSLGRQAEALDRWSQRTGATLLAIFFDPAVSRTTEHAERPGLAAALDAVRSLRASVLVAETVSRWAFDAPILESIRTALRSRGARLATADETGDADLDEDRQDFECLYSKREIKQIRARTKGALAVKRLRGERVGAIPFGKCLDPDGKHLAPCPAEQAIIVRAKQLSDLGLSIRKIAASLDAEGCLGRTGWPLSHTQVHRIVKPLLEAERAA